MPTSGELNLEFAVMLETDVPTGLDPNRLAALAESTLLAEGAKGHWTVTLLLTGDPALQELHARFLGADSVTDVMTFPLGGEDNAPRGGDIVVSVDRAAAQAPDFGLSAADEVRFLVVHGLLHLLGWNDDTESHRTAMLDRQTALLAEFDQSCGGA